MDYQTAKIQLKPDDLPEAVRQPRAFQPGMVLWDRYRITAVLGEDELGERWLCEDLRTGREAFLRWLAPDLKRSKPAMAAIHAAIRRISNQTHPNLAAVRQMIFVGEHVFLAGDYAPGLDAGAWTRQGLDGRRTLDEVLPVLRQVAATLDFAHARRIIHGNIKPENIHLDDAGAARVADFGLAPRHRMAMVNGEAVRVGTTGPYLAPELRDGEEEPDSASDQYALGVLAWELLAGHAPGLDEAPPADLPGAARTALRRAMARKPRNRIVNCTDFVRALGGEKVGGRRGRSPAEWRRIRIALETALALVILGACLGLGGYMLIQWYNKPIPPPPLPVPRPPPVAPPKPKVQLPPPVEPLVATTPLPVEGKPWVARTVPMEFVWIPEMRMWVGRFEITNGEYRGKEPAHDSGEFRGLGLDGSRQPAVRVNFDDTVAFAAWLTEQERAAGKLQDGWRYRVPSSYEAITYTRSGRTRLYPWGETWPPVRGNYADEALAAAFPDLPSVGGYQDGFPATAPVESSGQNEWGLFGAGGNVWETTSKAPGGPVFGGWQGGGWDDYLPTRTECTTLYGFIGNARGAVNGFRLVLAPIAGETPPPAAPGEPAP